MQTFTRYIFLAATLLFFIADLAGQDNTPPDRPYISFVTVDTATNNTIIHWTKSPSADVEYYYIYYEIFDINGYEGIKLDSVDASINEYTDLDAGADKKNLLYSVTAADSSGNESLRTPGLHGTVHTRLRYDSCQQQMIISWNKYIGWEDNVSGYRIYESIDHSEFILLDGVGASDSTFTRYNVEENREYRYFVEAVKNEGLKSLSNIALKQTYMPPPPGAMNLEYVTVPEKNVTEIKFTIEDPTEVNDFALLRSSVRNSDFIMVNTIEDLDSPSYIFSDMIITSNEKYFYKIAALNTCRRIISTSNLGTNILLKADTVEQEVHLEWSLYENWPQGVAYYQILRMDENGNFTVIGTTPPGTTTFTDRLDDITAGTMNGELKYKVKAGKNDSEVTSVSNEVTVNVNTAFEMIANAFTPNDDGINDVFRPVINFSPEKYLLIIYDRYGVPVFETEDSNEGWDGRINGNNKATEGVYIYHIQYTSYSGVTNLKTGKVTVYYPR